MQMLRHRKVFFPPSISVTAYKKYLEDHDIYNAAAHIRSLETLGVYGGVSSLISLQYASH